MQWVIRLILMSIITSVFQGWHPVMVISLLSKEGRGTDLHPCGDATEFIENSLTAGVELQHEKIHEYFYFFLTLSDPWGVGQCPEGTCKAANPSQEWLLPFHTHLGWKRSCARGRLSILHRIQPSEWQAIRKTILMYFPPICGFFCPQSVFCLTVTSKQKFSCKMTTGK